MQPDDSHDMVREATVLPPPENKVFYPALNGVRAIAVLLVFAQHYVHRPTYLSWGWTGVDIFFVLSGFLITGILYDTRDSEKRFQTFYVRRTLRIFPLFYGILLLTFVLTPLLRWTWDTGWLLWPLYLGNYARFLHFNAYLGDTSVYDILRSQVPGLHSYGLNFSHFWSLCVEEQFYLVWPPIVYWVYDRVRLRNLCLAVIVVTPIIRTFCAMHLAPPLLDADFLYRFTPLRVDALLLGALIALGLRGPERSRLVAAAPWTAKVLLTIFASIFAGILIHTGHLPDPSVHVRWIETIGFTLVDALAASIILLVLRPAGLMYRLLNIRPLRKLGEISYGFYVFHLIFQQEWLGLGRMLFGVGSSFASPAAAAFALVSTLIVAILSYRYFESPWLRLKGRFVANRPLTATGIDIVKCEESSMGLPREKGVGEQ